MLGGIKKNLLTEVLKLCTGNVKVVICRYKDFAGRQKMPTFAPANLTRREATRPTFRCVGFVLTVVARLQQRENNLSHRSISKRSRHADFRTLRRPSGTLIPPPDMHTRLSADTSRRATQHG